MKNLRISEVLEKSQLLYDDKWCQLRRVVDEKHNIFGYTFLHEIRCDGNIISILPYRILNEEFEFLFRREATPCWELSNPVYSSLTGGVDRGMNQISTVLKELEEESGYVVSEKDLINLGTSYGTKSTSTTYYIFSVDLTDKEPDKPLYVETELERFSSCKWGTYEDIISCMDPHVSVAYVRLMDYLFKR